MKIVYHDLDEDYARERNRLIPEAEKAANKQFGRKCTIDTDEARKEWGADWSRAFHKMMKSLWQEAVNEKTSNAVCHG